MFTSNRYVSTTYTNEFRCWSRRRRRRRRRRHRDLVTGPDRSGRSRRWFVRPCKQSSVTARIVISNYRLPAGGWTTVPVLSVRDLWNWRTKPPSLLEMEKQTSATALFSTTNSEYLWKETPDLWGRRYRPRDATPFAPESIPLVFIIYDRSHLIIALSRRRRR